MENYSEHRVFNFLSKDKVSKEQYLLDDKLHRTDGPAIIKYDRDGLKYYEEYCIHGLAHRENGPAYIEFNNGKVVGEAYLLLGKLVSKEDFYTPGFIDAFILEHS